MTRSLVVAVLALGLFPAAGAAQQDAAARIDAARARAAAAGIPTSLLDSRIAEGKAKGIPMDRIAAVIERREAALARAQTAMAGVRGLSAADLAAGADALEAGIDGSALRSLIDNARTQDRPVAIAVLTYLHRERGVPVDQALTRVKSALAEGPDALRTLPSRAASARERRGPPEGVRARGKAGGPSAGPPAGVPAPGHKPGAGKPDDSGRPDRPGKPAGPGGPGHSGHSTGITGPGTPGATA